MNTSLNCAVWKFVAGWRQEVPEGPDAHLDPPNHHRGELTSARENFGESQ